MELSPQALELSHLILKHYDTKKTPSNENQESKEKNPNPSENIVPDLKTKYSMDYKKFESASNENDEKLKPEEDPFKTNPYLAQMGCSHDRRKVLQNHQEFINEFYY